MSDNKTDALQNWIAAAREVDLIPWERLPELELYMDQVITLMNRQLPMMATDSDRPLTSSMINNYVKDGVMPRPSAKKYNREHLTILSIICMLKSVFTLDQTCGLVTGLSEHYSAEELYTAFCQMQADSLSEAATKTQAFETLSEAERYQLALQLALDANAKRIAAANLLYSLTPEAADEPKEKKKSDKEKPPKEKKKA